MSSMHTTMLGDRGRGDQRWCPNREGVPKLIRFKSPRWRPKSSSSPSRVSGPVCLKLVTQDAYGLRFRRSTYGWKILNWSKSGHKILFSWSQGFCRFWASFLNFPQATSFTCLSSYFLWLLLLCSYVKKKYQKNKYKKSKFPKKTTTV